MSRVFIIPGYTARDVTNCSWYPWVREKVKALAQVEDCILRNMPDPVGARRNIWLPFMESDLQIGEKDIIVGHSSGAVAAIRYAETCKVGGIVLVGAYSSDLGDDLEKASGYFNGQWLFAKTRENCQHIVQFGSTDDPFLPWESQLEIASGLDCDLKKFSDKGHFQHSSFPEIMPVIKDMLNKLSPH